MAKMRVALTGGIACGKSLVTKFLNEFGVETIDADDVVHEIISAEERKRLAKIVFSNPAAKAELEAKIHPIVEAKIERFIGEKSKKLRIAVIPLLFEVHWDEKFDIICTVTSAREMQISRMMTTRGYTRREAEERMAAQLPVAEKAARSQYVIGNDGSEGELKSEVENFVEWLTVKWRHIERQ